MNQFVKTRNLSVLGLAIMGGTSTNFGMVDGLTVANVVFEGVTIVIAVPGWMKAVDDWLTSTGACTIFVAEKKPADVVAEPIGTLGATAKKIAIAIPIKRGTPTPTPTPIAIDLVGVVTAERHAFMVKSHEYPERQSQFPLALLDAFWL